MCLVVFELDVVVDGVVDVASLLVVVRRVDVDVDESYATENKVVVVEDRDEASLENVVGEGGKKEVKLRGSDGH